MGGKIAKDREEIERVEGAFAGGTAVGSDGINCTEPNDDFSISFAAGNRRARLNAIDVVYRIA